MKYWYTARQACSPIERNDAMDWDAYMNWARLYHLKELVSLDTMLCGLAMHVDYESEELYRHMLVDNEYGTDLFDSLEFVLSKIKSKNHINLLAVVKEPNQECRDMIHNDFTFQGYELLDEFYEISALTNCGGFDEAFVPTD